MKISLLSSYEDNDKCPCIVCICMLVLHGGTPLERVFLLCFTKALYERKPNIVAYDPEVDKLQAQVEQWEAAAKESQGKLIR